MTGEHATKNNSSPEEQNTTMDLTKDSPYPIVDDEIYVLQLEEKYDTYTYVVQGIQNASRKAYEIIKNRWDDGYYYAYSRKRHKGIVAEIKEQRKYHKQITGDLQMLAQKYRDAGNDGQALIMDSIIKKYEDEDKLIKLYDELDDMKKNENFWYLMQAPMEEAIRFVHHGKYTTLRMLESRVNYQYEGFYLRKTDLIK